MNHVTKSDDVVRIGLNGFGRIGRSVFRAALSHPGVELAGVNDIMSADEMRYLLTYDSVFGRNDDVSLVDDSLVVGDTTVPVYGEQDPSQLPWDDQEVDVALECTGLFRTYNEAAYHLDAGATKVLISAPPKGTNRVFQIVYGVNHEEYGGEDILSNASCTTNSVAPVVKVLDDAFGVGFGLLTTVHAYTSSQHLVDGPAGSRRRGRAAAENIIPTTTGAANATSEILPQLKGKIDGMAMRVPIPNGSITDLVMGLNEDVGASEVNDALRTAANGELTGVVGCTNEAIVSRDIIGLPYSSLVDLESTIAIDGGIVKVLAWYDNEVGFSHRMLDVSEFITRGKISDRSIDPISSPT